MAFNDGIYIAGGRTSSPRTAAGEVLVATPINALGRGTAAATPCSSLSSSTVGGVLTKPRVALDNVDSIGGIGHVASSNDNSKNNAYSSSNSATSGNSAVCSSSVNSVGIPRISSGANEFGVSSSEKERAVKSLKRRVAIIREKRKFLDGECPSTSGWSAGGGAAVGDYEEEDVDDEGLTMTIDDGIPVSISALVDEDDKVETTHHRQHSGASDSNNSRAGGGSSTVGSARAGIGDGLKSVLTGNKCGYDDDATTNDIVKLARAQRERARHLAAGQYIPLKSSKQPTELDVLSVSAEDDIEVQRARLLDSAEHHHHEFADDDDDDSTKDPMARLREQVDRMRRRDEFLGNRSSSIALLADNFSHPHLPRSSSSNVGDERHRLVLGNSCGGGVACGPISASHFAAVTGGSDSVGVELLVGDDEDEFELRQIQKGAQLLKGPDAAGMRFNSTRHESNSMCAEDYTYSNHLSVYSTTNTLPLQPTSVNTGYPLVDDCNSSSMVLPPLVPMSTLFTNGTSAATTATVVSVPAPSTLTGQQCVTQRTGSTTTILVPPRSSNNSSTGSTCSPDLCTATSTSGVTEDLFTGGIEESPYTESPGRGGGGSMPLRIAAKGYDDSMKSLEARMSSLRINEERDEEEIKNAVANKHKLAQEVQSLSERQTALCEQVALFDAVLSDIQDFSGLISAKKSIIEELHQNLFRIQSDVANKRLHSLEVQFTDILSGVGITALAVESNNSTLPGEGVDEFGRSTRLTAAANDMSRRYRMENYSKIRRRCAEHRQNLRNLRTGAVGTGAGRDVDVTGGPVCHEDDVCDSLGDESWLLLAESDPQAYRLSAKGTRMHTVSHGSRVKDVFSDVDERFPSAAAFLSPSEGLLSKIKLQHPALYDDCYIADSLCEILEFYASFDFLLWDPLDLTCTEKRRRRQNVAQRPVVGRGALHSSSTNDRSPNVDFSDSSYKQHDHPNAEHSDSSDHVQRSDCSSSANDNSSDSDSEAAGSTRTAVQVKDTCDRRSAAGDPTTTMTSRSDGVSSSVVEQDQMFWYSRQLVNREWHEALVRFLDIHIDDEYINTGSNTGLTGGTSAKNTHNGKSKNKSSTSESKSNTGKSKSSGSEYIGAAAMNKVAMKHLVGMSSNLIEHCWSVFSHKETARVVELIHEVLMYRDSSNLSQIETLLNIVVKRVKTVCQSLLWSPPDYLIKSKYEGEIEDLLRHHHSQLVEATADDSVDEASVSQLLEDARGHLLWRCAAVARSALLLLPIVQKSIIYEILEDILSRKMLPLVEVVENCCTSYAPLLTVLRAVPDNAVADLAQTSGMHRASRLLFALTAMRIQSVVKQSNASIDTRSRSQLSVPRCCSSETVQHGSMLSASTEQLTRFGNTDNVAILRKAELNLSEAQCAAL
eukprot:Lankesteria_metandrocarpae@DN4155_c0_g1_i1.p1